MAPVPPPLKPTDLNVEELYIAPTGRLCRLMPRPRSGPGSGDSGFSFEYVDGARRLKEPDAFFLSPGNVGVLKRGVRP